MTETAALRQLADCAGVATWYDGWDGRRRDVADHTLVAVLAALGYEASNDDQVAESLAGLALAPWRLVLPPTVVTVAGRDAVVPVHVTHGDPVSVHVITEDGHERPCTQLDVWVDPRQVDGRLVGRASFAVPTDLPLGWHRLVATGSVTAQTTLVVTPARLTTTDALTGPARWGLLAQLYSVRSRRSWGIGDFGDLADIASIMGADHGADFVLINPVHAAEPTAPTEASPYLPTTRRFVSPLYIDVLAVPEAARLGPEDHAELRKSARKFRKINRGTDLLDRNRTLEAKMAALLRIYRVRRSPHRQRAFEDFRRRQGVGLEKFATWCALIERYGVADPRWQSVAARPDTEWVARKARKLSGRIDFHCWLQWVADAQLAAAQSAALASGMDIGIIVDLAVGVHPTGADAWALGSALAHDVSVGAPPDAFNQQGQQWNQPPWHPTRLAEQGYAPYRDMLRTVLRHAGGIRVDHILGLFRLWWIPADSASPAGGTYVRYDHEALIGILALEAERAGAVVIGEDLGVFEPVVQHRLAERGILGTSILWFEKGDDDRPVPPENYRRLALTSVTTHDLPPTAGYLDGAHIDLRARLGLLERPVEEEAEQDSLAQARVLDLARERGLLTGDATVEQTVRALHTLIARSPSMLLGVALVDLVGDRRIQNQPGTDETQYENWRVPLTDAQGRAVSVDDLRDLAPIFI